MKEKSIVMKMLFEKLKAAFGTGVPDYKVSVCEGEIKVIEGENNSVWFYAMYDDEIESFVYAGGGIDSSILRALVNIENAIEEEYPYPEETVEYTVYGSRDDNPNKYEPWCTFNTLEEAKSEMDEFKPRFRDRDFYILKTTTIEEKVIL